MKNKIPFPLSAIQKFNGIENPSSKVRIDSHKASTTSSAIKVADLTDPKHPMKSKTAERFSNADAPDFKAPSLAYIRAGFRIIPCYPKSKIPAVTHAAWFSDYSEAAIISYWIKNPNHEIANIPGNNLVSLDADTPEGITVLDQLEAQFGIKANFVVNTAKGQHRHYRIAKGVCVRSAAHSTSKHPDRIDIKTGNLPIMMPPSTGKSIVVNHARSVDELTEVNQNFIDAIAIHNGQQPPRPYIEERNNSSVKAVNTLSIPQIILILGFISSESGYDQWLRVLMAIYNYFDGSEEGFELVKKWSEPASNYCGEKELRKKWQSFSRNNNGRKITIATLIKMAKGNGATDNELAFDRTETVVVHPKNLNTETAHIIQTQSKKNAAPTVNRETTMPAVTAAMALEEKLIPESFPQTKNNSFGVAPLETIPNYIHLLSSYGITVKYNVITKKVEIDIPGFSGTPDNIDNSTLATITSLARLNGISTSQVMPYLVAIADKNQYNPVAKWIDSKAWDGVDRLQELYSTITPTEDYPTGLRDTLMYRWLLSAVAAIYKPSGFKTRGVLTIQGPQSMGKTSWLTSLIPLQVLQETVILIDHSLDVGNKDSVKLAISHWIVELGELESCFKRDVAKLKGFVTSDRDKIRLPYARVESEFPRRTIFYATVNDAQFLVDNTGNSRFWTISASKINFQHQIDMQQVWAQLAQIYGNGNEQWWLTQDEERLLEKNNQNHRASSTIRDLIETELNFDTPEAKWVRMTSTGVLQAVGMKTPSNPQARECGQILRDKFGEPKKSQGSMRWLVPPVRNDFVM